MRSLGSLILTLSLLFQPQATRVGASSSSSEGSLATLAKELETKFGPIRFHREEDLEDRFIVQASSHLREAAQPRFFLIEPAHSGPSDDNRPANLLTKLPRMYVALGDDKNAYRLFGFTGAESEFNRLIGDSPKQEMHSADDAEARGLFCGEVVYGLVSRFWIADGSNAQILAAQHFFDSGHADGLSRAQRWWNSLKGNRRLLSIETRKREESGFVVRLPVFWAPVEGTVAPQIRVYQIEVATVGTCHMDESPVEVLR